MAKAWPAKVKADAVAELLDGATIPAVSASSGVPIGTLRTWKRQARKPAQVLDMRGEPAEVDPLAAELEALCSPDPEVAINAQMRVLVREKAAATQIGQYGAAATMQKQIAQLRAELTEHRANQPKDDPLDMTEADALRKLESTARRWPDTYLERVVSVYLDRTNTRIVEAANGRR